MRSSRRGLVGWLALGIILFGVGLDASAREAVVVTHDGRQFEGELINETPEEIVLEIAGIRTPIPRDQVKEINIKKTIEEEYRERRAGLEDDDLEGRYALAYYLFEQEAYGLAERELESLLEQFPDAERPKLLLTVVQERQKLARESQQNRPPLDDFDLDELDPGDLSDLDGAEQRLADPEQRLTEEQVNLIRVWELPANLREARPAVIVPPDIITEFLEKYRDRQGVPRGRDEQRRFRAAPGYEQMAAIFDAQAQEFYDDVRVPRDPPAMLAFRTQIHRQYVINYCATTQCHGGATAPGGLYLFRQYPNDPRTVYSNFYILQQYENDQGEMIDRDRPERSLLLQYGLAREAAAAPHPDVPGWRPQFFRPSEPRFQQYAEVIDNLYPNPRYGISYTPPGSRANPPDGSPDGAADNATEPAPAGPPAAP